jgi:hypothetical protein
MISRIEQLSEYWRFWSFPIDDNARTVNVDAGRNVLHDRTIRVVGRLDKWQPGFPGGRLQNNAVAARFRRDLALRDAWLAYLLLLMLPFAFTIFASSRSGISARPPHDVNGLTWMTACD